MPSSFPAVPLRNPSTISKPNPQSSRSTVPGRSTGDGSNALYQEKLLLLIDEKMNTRLLTTRFHEAEDPWPLLQTLEEEYQRDLPTYKAFLALQQSLGITEGATPPFSGCRAGVIITSYMLSVVDIVLSLQSGSAGNLMTERAKLPLGLLDTMIVYNKAVCQGQHKLCTDILRRLHRLFEKTPGIRTQHFGRGYFLKCIYGQMKHSISQHLRAQQEEKRRQEEAQKHQEEEQRRREEERERRRQEEEQRQIFKDKKVRECQVAIGKGHFGTVQTILDLPDVGNDTIVLEELIQTAQAECHELEKCRDEWSKTQALNILQYLRKTLKLAKK